MGNNNGVLTMILTFMFIDQITSGPVVWLYATETTVDAALGICILTLWGTVFLLSFISPILMKDSVLGASNVFFLFAGLSALGCIYSIFVIKETMGLSEK